jgi:hypothetical protein
VIRTRWNSPFEKYLEKHFLHYGKLFRALALSTWISLSRCCSTEGTLSIARGSARAKKLFGRPSRVGIIFNRSDGLRSNTHLVACRRMWGWESEVMPDEDIWKVYCDKDVASLEAAFEAR